MKDFIINPDKEYAQKIIEGIYKKDGYKQMIIECQNTNVQACKFYQKQGAVLSKIDMYAYYLDPEIKNEIQFVWYLNI